MKCNECNGEIHSMVHFFKGKCDKQKNKIMDGVNGIIDAHNDIMLKDVAVLLIKAYPFLTMASGGRLIRERRTHTGVNSWKIMAENRTGKDNPVYNHGVIDRIKNSVKERWKSGDYSNRINGMKGKRKLASPVYKINTHTLPIFGEINYVKFLSLFHNVDTCAQCGSMDKRMNVHHIDENNKNYLPSNLEPLCVNCHTKYHYTRHKQPFTIIVKSFSFAGAHNLPLHKGLCNFQHGHEWKLDIAIKKRVNPDTGMVVDFSYLKELVNMAVIDEFDHSNMNEHLNNPTAENIAMLIWFKLMYSGLKGIHSIKVWEGDGSYVEIGMDDAFHYLNGIYDGCVFAITDNGKVKIDRLKVK